jgi:ADP-ribosylglycohydrolase
MDSITQTKKIDTNDIASKFLDWFRNSNYTATGETFDIGRTTLQSLAKFESGIEDAEKCGQAGIMDNGNGSLMRMLPIAYYIVFNDSKENKMSDKDIYNIVKKVSSITHANEISILGCYIFVRFAIEIINGKFKDLSYEYIKSLDYSFFSQESIQKYHRILNEDIKKEHIDTIKTTGYIVDTLEAVFWLFLNSKDYNNTILEAVNLGDDTDTVAAITGGLLGIYYGIEKINDKWKNDLKKIEYIEEICDAFYKANEVD